MVLIINIYYMKGLIRMGKFIVIEGTDCSGKETQSRLLVEKLTQLGKKAIRLTFTNYD